MKRYVVERRVDEGIRTFMGGFAVQFAQSTPEGTKE